MGDPVTTGAGGSEVEPAPAVAVAQSITTRQPLIPKDGFHDTRESMAAERGGFPTEAGYPLHPAAQQVLKGLTDAIAGIRSWADWAEAQVAKAASIGAGDQS